MSEELDIKRIRKALNNTQSVRGGLMAEESRIKHLLEHENPHHPYS